MGIWIGAWILYSQNSFDFSLPPEILITVALQYKLLRSSTSQVCWDLEYNKLYTSFASFSWLLNSTLWGPIRVHCMFQTILPFTKTFISITSKFGFVKIVKFFWPCLGLHVCIFCYSNSKFAYFLSVQSRIYSSQGTPMYLRVNLLPRLKHCTDSCKPGVQVSFISRDLTWPQLSSGHTQHQAKPTCWLLRFTCVIRWWQGQDKIINSVNVMNSCLEITEM